MGRLREENVGNCIIANSKVWCSSVFWMLTPGFGYATDTRLHQLCWNVVDRLHFEHCVLNDFRPDRSALPTMPLKFIPNFNSIRSDKFILFHAHISAALTVRLVCYWNNDVQSCVLLKLIMCDLVCYSCVVLCAIEVNHVRSCVLLKLIVRSCVLLKLIMCGIVCYWS